MKRIDPDEGCPICGSKGRESHNSKIYVKYHVAGQGLRHWWRYRKSDCPGSSVEHLCCTCSVCHGVWMRAPITDAEEEE